MIIRGKYSMRLNLDEIMAPLSKGELPEREDFINFINNAEADDLKVLSNAAVTKSREIFGNGIYIRGLIEFTNICKNNCYYCGIRLGNKGVDRYRLDKSEILSCCEVGYSQGFRTFVLQGGEDNFFDTERLCDIIYSIKAAHSDCAVTLSIGEKSYDCYKSLFEAGADRFLLRHETANADHYSRLHPSELTLKNRMSCLYNLKKIGYQTGCGFMVGSPYQTLDNLYDDLSFIKDFGPAMVGIGPFIPAKGTPFADFSKGSARLTCTMLSFLRLLKPNLLLPATTALATAEEDGRLNGILSGANVIMPNLSPSSVRDKYSLYDNKVATGLEGSEGLRRLNDQVSSIGYKLVVDRGDSPDFILK